VRVTLHEPFHLGGPLLVEHGGRPRCEDVLGEGTAEQRVHPALGIAHRHRAERVPVVAAADRQQPPAPGRLERQLERNLDRDRPGIGEEHVVKPRPRHESLGEPHRRLVRQPPEHHVRHSVQLRTHGGVEHRMAVPMDRAPPGSHPIDQLAAVGEREASSLRRHNRERRLGRGHRSVGVPDDPAVYVEQRAPSRRQDFLSRRPHGGEPSAEPQTASTATEQASYKREQSIIVHGSHSRGAVEEPERLGDAPGWTLLCIPSR
jgi:hypothetical protein